MRLVGIVTDPRGLGPHDHLCWFYDRPEHYADAARRFLLDGLERGERLLCVGDTAVRTATEGAAAVPDADQLVAAGRLRLHPLAAVYREGGVPRGNAERLRFYADAVEQARAEGYRGLRVAAEVTELAAEPAGRDDHLAWEVLADRFIAGGPGMSTMCAYRADALDEPTRAGLAAVHPLTGGRTAAGPFRLHADGGVLVLDGDIDAFCVGQLTALLHRFPADGPLVTLDVSGIRFIDAAGTAALARWGRALAAQGSGLRLHDAPRVLRRVWTLLGLSGATFD